MKDYNSLINSKYFMKEIKKSPFKDLDIPKPEIMCSLPFEYKEFNKDEEKDMENGQDEFYKKVIEPIVNEVVKQTECEIFMEDIEKRAEMSNEAVFDLINKAVMLNLESKAKKELIEKSGLELYIGFDNGDTERLMISATFTKHQGEGLTVSLSKSKDVNDFTDKKINFLIYTKIQAFSDTLVELFGFVSRDESYYDNIDFERKEKEALEEIEAKYEKWFDDVCNTKDISCFRHVYDCAGTYIVENIKKHLYLNSDCDYYPIYKEIVGEDYLMISINILDNEDELIQDFNFKVLENTEMPCVPNYQNLLEMFKIAEDKFMIIRNVIEEKEKEKEEEEIEKYGYTLQEMLDDSDLLEESMMRKIQSNNLSTEHIDFENMDEEDDCSYGFLVYRGLGSDVKIEIMNNKACINSIKDTFESLETAVDILERLM